MDFKDLVKEKYTKDTLLELLELSSDEIKEQLDMIAEYTKNEENPIYPFYEYVTGDNGKKVAIKKEVSSKDSVKVANLLVARMRSFLQSETHKISNPLENAPEFCSWLRYLESYLATEEEKDEFLANFDEKFSYLENIPCYSSIYHLFRKDYIREFERILHRRHGYLTMQKIGIENALMYPAWRGDSGYSRAIRKHLQGKVRK